MDLSFVKLFIIWGFPLPAVLLHRLPVSRPDEHRSNRTCLRVEQVLSVSVQLQRHSALPCRSAHSPPLRGPALISGYHPQKLASPPRCDVNHPHNHWVQPSPSLVTPRTDSRGDLLRPRIDIKTIDGSRGVGK